MSEIILYPTETVYALGVNPLDEAAWKALCALKQRDISQSVSWLVRDAADIDRYAQVDEQSRRLIARLLPGSVTLVLPAAASVPKYAQSSAGTVSFRISPDPVAQELIATHMATHDTPLTCTSANVHQLPTLPEPTAILAQFGPAAAKITQVVDDGIRQGIPSTVVQVVEGGVRIIRPGAVSTQVVLEALG